MRKYATFRWLVWAFTGIYVSTGCHQEPAVPQSAIPLTCRIDQTATVNETLRDTTSFVYNAFGSITESTYRQWWQDTLTVGLRRNYTYNADHYLTVRIDQHTRPRQTPDVQSSTYTYQNNLVQQVVIKNDQTGQISGFLEYTYDGGKLRTYIERNGQQTELRRFTFDATGKLTDYREPSALLLAQVAGGKVVLKLLKDSTRVASAFDDQGQLISETTTAGRTETKLTYRYDNEPNWDRTQLRLRGIPEVDRGGHAPVHNLLSLTIQQTVNGRVTQSRTLTYRNVYNSARYLLGYARSDGAQQRNSFVNCP